MRYELTSAGADARRLAYFLAVVDAGTVTAAAARLQVAQPSVSLAIRDLERDFGTSLFNRVGRRLVLNETGRSLVEVARQVVGGLASARTVVGARADLTSGEVTVTAPASLALDPLGPVIAAFCRRYPGVRLVVLGAASSQTRDLVAAADADLGLTTEEADNAGRRTLVERDIGLHEIVAVLPPQASASVPAGRLTTESAAMIVAILGFARLSDTLGRTKVKLAGALFVVAYPFPLFALLETAQPTIVRAAVVAGFIGASALFGPMAAFLAELFPTSVAYSGVSVGYSIGAVLGGGLAPFLASVLMQASGGASRPDGG